MGGKITFWETFVRAYLRSSFSNFLHFRFLNLLFVFFRYNQTDFYANPGPTGMEFKGPIWHPLRALYNLTAWSMFILVPIFYRSIFKLRKVQDLTSGTIGPCHRNIRNIKYCKRTVPWGGMYCIRTLPRGGMYWVVRPRRPRDVPRAKPEGHPEGRGKS